VVVRGRYKLNFESVLVWSQASTRRSANLTKAGLGQYVEQWRIRNRKYSTARRGKTCSLHELTPEGIIYFFDANRYAATPFAMP